MADEPQATETTEEQEKPRRRRSAEPSGEQPQRGVRKSAPDVPVSQLIADSGALLGVPRWTAAGALRDHDTEEMMNIDAAKAEVQGWLASPVATAEQEEE